MTKFFIVRDEYLALRGRQVPNRIICVYLAIFQLAICLWALGQHIFSVIAYKQVLKCDFDNATGFQSLIASVDVIIFDVGLFHSLWGIDGCVAEKLDGGYGRFACLSLASFLPVAICIKHPSPFLLWPLLIQQSAYGIGLLILSLAALPRLLPAFMGEWNALLIFPVFVYILGAGMNFFLLYVYWHYFWHVEAQHKMRKAAAKQNAARIEMETGTKRQFQNDMNVNRTAAMFEHPSRLFEEYQRDRQIPVDRIDQHRLTSQFYRQRNFPAIHSTYC